MLSMLCNLKNAAAAGELWKDKEGTPTDSYTWGKVDVPTTHGPVVQISAGKSFLPIFEALLKCMHTAGLQFQICVC